MLSLISFLTYARTLGNGLTGRDLPGLLLKFKEASLVELFSQGLPDEVGSFYRPFAALTFQLNFRWFGLDALGYHLTDLMVHVFVVLALYAFLRAALPMRREVALLAGGIMALHPAAVEVIPNISHRMDALVTLFVLLALWCVARLPFEAVSPRRFRFLYLLSLLWLVLAMLSKEVGFIGFLLIGSYWFLLGRAPSLWLRARAAALAMLPYAFVTVVLFWWRAQVLNGAGMLTLGGFAAAPGDWLKQRTSDFINYVWFLLAPQSLYPGAFDENQLGFFLRANTLQILILGIGIGSLLLLWWTRRHLSAYRWQLTNGERMALFAVLWLLIPFLLYAVTLFRFRYIYFSIPPFAILIAFVTVALASAYDAAAARSPHRERTAAGLQVMVYGVGLFACLILLGQLLYLSPLVQAYDNFYDSGQGARALIASFEANEKEFRTASAITVQNLPDPQWEPSWTKPQPRELSHLWVPAFYRLVIGDTTPKWCVASFVKSNRAAAPVEFVRYADGQVRITYSAADTAARTTFKGCCQSTFCK